MPRDHDSRHDRYVAGLYATVRQVNRGGRLGGTRHSDEHYISFFQVLQMLAIIMQHRVVERVDPLEVISVQGVLRPDTVRGFGSKIGLQKLQDWSQDRQTGQAQLAAMIFK